MAELTPREREVLALLVCGERHKVIAAQLNISPRTVEIHCAHIRAKLQVRTTPALVRAALDRHLVTPPSLV